MGHALGGCVISAASLGWHASIHGLFPDHEVAALFALEDTDEKPGLIIGLNPAKSFGEPDAQLATGSLIPDLGRPNQLSLQQIDYPIVEEVQSATSSNAEDYRRVAALYGETHPSRPDSLVAAKADVPLLFDTAKASAGCVDQSVHTTIRRRRSAVDMEGKRRMSLEDLSTIIGGATRGFAADFQSPLSTGSDHAAGHYLIDLFLYVHRVDGLHPGLYFFDRRKQVLVPLLESDQREMSKNMSCFQDIAANGCFALSMIADLALAFKLYGDRGYRLVHYEAGLIGQLLYLGATALDYDSTGIGCFAKWSAVEPNISSRSRPLVEAEKLVGCDVIYYLPSITTSAPRLRTEIGALRNKFDDAVEKAHQQQSESALVESFGKRYASLVIVDEAYRLNYKALEELRDLHDKWKIGMVLIGDLGLERSLDRQPHFVNRAAFVHAFNQLTPVETKEYVQTQSDRMNLERPEDEIYTAISWYTKGNLRTLEKLFRMLGRLIKLNTDTVIKRDVLDAAREMLLYGNIRPSEKVS